MIIYKYPLKPSPIIQELYLPFGTQTLSVVAQNNEVMIYCTLETPDADTIKHRYAVIGTGWETDFGEEFPKFIGTVVIGVYVWHVFELHDLPF